MPTHSNLNNMDKETKKVVKLIDEAKNNISFILTKLTSEIEGIYVHEGNIPFKIEPKVTKEPEQPPF